MKKQKLKDLDTLMAQAMDNCDALISELYVYANPSYGCSINILDKIKYLKKSKRELEHYRRVSKRALRGDMLSNIELDTIGISKIKKMFNNIIGIKKYIKGLD